MSAETLPRYYVGLRRVRYAANVVTVIVATAVLALIGLLVQPVDSRGRLTQGIARCWARILLAGAGIRVRVEGLDRLDPDGAYLFAANHSSAIDIPAMLVGLPYRLRMLAKASLFSIPLFGWYIRTIGYVPVDRTRPANTRKVLRRALEGAGRGASLTVFPEGTRNPEGDLGPFKRGAVVLAREAGLPIVPVAIVNAGHLMPRGELRADPGVVELRVGEPIIPEPGEPARRLSATIRRRVQELRTADRLR